MTATTPVAFDPDPERPTGPTRTFKAASAILSGQVVAFADSGVSNTVAPATTSLAAVAGVALTSQATAGGDVTVAMDGSIVTVMMAADDSAIDAGHWVMVGAVAGTVIEYDPAIGSHAATQDAQSTAAIGKTLEDSVVGAATVGSKVKIIILTSPQHTAAS
jgi:hypothetical protein